MNEQTKKEKYLNDLLHQIDVEEWVLLQMRNDAIGRMEELYYYDPKYK